MFGIVKIVVVCKLTVVFQIDLNNFHKAKLILSHKQEVFVIIIQICKLQSYLKTIFNFLSL